MSSPQQRPFLEVVKHTLIYGSGYVATAAVGFLLVPVYTHRFEPAEYGLLALLLVLYGFMGMVYDLGFTNSVGRFFFDCKGEERENALRRMVGTALSFMAAYAGLLTAVLCIGAGSVAEVVTGDAANAGLIRLVAVALLADALAIVPLTLIRMEERSGIYILITIVRSTAALGLNVLFVVGLGWGVRGVAASLALTAGGVLLCLVPEIRRRLGGGVSWPLLRQMLGFGLPFFPVLLCSWVVEASDRYILELFRGPEEVGFYALGYKIAQIMQIAVTAFSMGWAPLRYKIFERESARAEYRGILTYYVMAAAVLGVAIAVLDRELVSLVAPANYAPAAGIVAPIVLAYATYGTYLIVLTGMGVTKRTGAMGWLAAAGAGLNVGLNFLLIPRYGMTAAALTTVAANLLVAWGGWFFSQRVYAISYDWTRVLGVVGLAVAAVLADHAWHPEQALGAWAWSLAVWFVFVGVLLATLARAELTKGLAVARAFLGRRRLPRVGRHLATGEVAE